MTITFLQFAQKVLVDEKQPLTAMEIWQVGLRKGYDKALGTNGKTPAATLGARLYVEVRDNPIGLFKSDGARPKRFFLKSQLELWDGKIPEIPDETTDLSKSFAYLEKDLHPLMVYFGYFNLKSYLKTIHHSKSEKKSYGGWVHPDIVGCYFPFFDWDSEVVDISNLMGNSALKLYSFELKRDLSLSNLRESFFQAVSNSSWANEGFLVVAEIDDDEDFMDELKRLSAAFGIGVIRLDTVEPDSCEILLPAKTRDYIDWDTVNKLSSMNPDFKEFLKRIQKDMKSREVWKDMYDKVIEKNDLLNLFTKKVSNKTE